MTLVISPQLQRNTVVFLIFNGRMHSLLYYCHGCRVYHPSKDADSLLISNSKLIIEALDGFHLRCTLFLLNDTFFRPSCLTSL